MSKSALRLFSIVLFAAAIHAQETSGWSDFRKAVISPRSIATNLAGAGLAQWRDATPEWGQGMEGYGKRFGSRVLHHAVKGSINFGISSWRHETRRYQRSGLDGKWPRLKHALVGTFWVPRTDGAGDTFAVGMLAGNFGSAAISRAWHPESTRTVGRAFTGGVVGVGIDTGVNVIREFWPFKKWKP